jgi:hypothetical protein
MSRVGIWCVEQKARRSLRGWCGWNEGRFAHRDGKILTFDTEAEALSEARALRAKHGFWAGGDWVFFTMPLATEASAGEP